MVHDPCRPAHDDASPKLHRAARRVERQRGRGTASRSRVLGRVAGAIGMVIGTVAFPAASRAQTARQADSAAGAPAFSGSAAGGGVRVTLNVPGAPATDTPVDGGGPTAQVAVDSIGSSKGYASFPDPGQFIVSIPGLAIGLLAGGAGGLPPINGLPSPPNYPFYVSSDAASAPQATLGSGPWTLSASSEPGSSKASAAAGIQTGVTGNAALATSTASLGPTTDGGVTATATSDLQGLTVGPLTLGEVRSSATETLDASGTVSPSVNLEIAGMRVGGVSVELAPQGVVAGGESYPVPLNSSLASLLKASGVSLRFVAAQKTPGKVVSPAVELTFPFAMPFPVPNVGQFHGTATLIIGSATAQMSGAAATPGTGAGIAPGAAGGAPSNAASGTGSVSALGSVAAGDTPTSPSLGTPGISAGNSSVPAVAGTTAGPGNSVAAPAAASFPALDVRSLYLMVLLGAIVVSAGGAIIRRVGVRA